MTYEESAELMNNLEFRGRIKVGGLKYATYIQGEPPETVAHSSRYKWAQLMAQMPDQQAANIQPMVVMDSQVQSDGAAITDENLQTSVESVVNKMI